MPDDLGRGMLGWTPERWQALDALATKSAAEQVVLRHLVDEQEAKDVYNARIGARNVDVQTIQARFEINMFDDDDKDVDRKVRLAAQTLAVREDEAIVGSLDLSSTQVAGKKDLAFKDFSIAKNALRSQGVQTGIGVVISADGLADLETEIVGTQSGLDVAEKVLSTKIMQTNALPTTKPIEAILLQAMPPSYQMVRAWGPRVRVLDVTDGKKVKLTVEEGIAVGELEPNRVLAIEPKP